MTPKLIDRLSKLIPVLSSDKDGELLAAVGRIRSALASENLDLHDLVKRLSEQPAAFGFGFDSSGFAHWAADFARRERERDADNKRREAEREASERAAEAERIKRAEDYYAAEKAAKAAARAAERATPQYKERVAQRRRDALARRAEAAAYEAAAAAERRESERIASEGPRWDEIGDAPRVAWVRRILNDPQAKLDPSTTEALTGIEAALVPQPVVQRRRQQKPKITVSPEWIASFEKAARDCALRQRGMRP